MKNKNITEWLCFSELGGDFWVLPILTAAQDACDSKKINPLPKKAHALGSHISTRLNMFPHIINKINIGCDKLYPKIKEVDPKYIFSSTKEGYGLSIDNNLKYNLIIDIDSLLFELNACCDFMKEFLEILYNHVGKTIKDAGSTIKKILQAYGQSIDWFIDLDTHRNFLLHEGTAYIAIDISNAPQKYDLIIMKENLKTFTDTRKFFLLTELSHIVQSFEKGKVALQKELILLFKNL